MISIFNGYPPLFSFVGVGIDWVHAWKAHVTVILNSPEKAMNLLIKELRKLISLSAQSVHSERHLFIA